MGEAELEAIRQRQLAELQQAAAQQETTAQHEAESRAQLHQLLRQAMTVEARERLGRIRTARPQLAHALEQQIAHLATEGRLPQPMDDDTFQQLLARITPPRREPTITIKGRL